MLWIIRHGNLYSMDHTRSLTLIGTAPTDTRQCPQCQRAGMTMPTCTQGIPEPFTRYECLKGHHWQVYQEEG